MKNSLNFVSTCLRVVDTRRFAASKNKGTEWVAFKTVCR